VSDVAKQVAVDLGFLLPALLRDHVPVPPVRSEDVQVFDGRVVRAQVRLSPTSTLTLDTNLDDLNAIGFHLSAIMAFGPVSEPSGASEEP